MHECVHLTQGIPQAPLQNTKQHASSVTVSIRLNLVQSISPQLPTVLQKLSCLLIAHSTVLCEALRKRKHFHGKINIQTCRSKNGGKGKSQTLQQLHILKPSVSLWSYFKYVLAASYTIWLIPCGGFLKISSAQTRLVK